jgi:putative SOS response-associated peptidase YedK
VGFAGVWETRSSENQDTLNRTCAIITAPATGVIAGLHDRMPVALPPTAWDQWLDRSLTDPEETLSTLEAIDDDLWMERPVSRLVNSVRNNGPELLEPDPQGRLI